MPEENKDSPTNSRHPASPSEFVPVDNFAEFQEYLAPDASMPSPPPAQPVYQTTFAPSSASPSPYSFSISTPERVPTSQPKRMRGIYMLLAVVALLLVAGAGGGLLFFTSHLRTPTLQTTGAQISQNDLTSSAVRTPTTPLAIYLQATSSTPIIDDPLNDASTSTWRNSAHPTADGHCAFSTDGYHIVAAKSQTFHFCNSAGSYLANFAFRVQMTILRGDAGGVIFRSTDRVGQFSLYRFRIDQDGQYGLYLSTGRTSNDVKTLIAGSSNAINTGLNQANVITVIASGSAIYLYANGLFVANVEDSTLSGGQIGLTATDYSNQTEVVFQDAKVWTI